MTPHGFIADTLNEFEFNHAISQQLHHVPRVLHDVQDSRSFGASLHTKAISAASCVASSFEAAPGGVLIFLCKRQPAKITFQPNDQRTQS